MLSLIMDLTVRLNPLSLHARTHIVLPARNRLSESMKNFPGLSYTNFNTDNHLDFDAVRCSISLSQLSSKEFEKEREEIRNLNEIRLQELYQF